MTAVIDKTLETYGIDNWGADYFGINKKGNLIVRAPENEALTADIKEIVDDLQKRGVSAPVLLRFPQLLFGQIRKLQIAFRKSIKEFEYEGDHLCVFPMKVNQNRSVIEEYLREGSRYNFGLEAGSKAELYAALGLEQAKDSLLVLNGFKDREFIQLAFAGAAAGKNVVIVIEKLSELEHAIAIADETQKANPNMKIPMLGVRVKLYAKGSGKWEKSGGEAAKFGLTTTEILEVIRRLQETGRTDLLRLLHFHIGSQIQDVISLKSAVKEITRVYAKLVKMGLGVKYIDVGGGLGVNYDSPEAGLEQSINYTLQEYVNGVVYTIKEICDIEGVPHPIIISESGRALTAHHSMLVVGVLSATHKNVPQPVPDVSDDDQPVVRELHDSYEMLSDKSTRKSGKGQRKARFLEIYHDAIEKRREADLLFSLGYLSLEDKGKTEQLFWAIMQHLNRAMKKLDPEESLPSDLYQVEGMLVDQYLCDFSVFQSIMDHWAIDQLFPIMPIHRLKEEPTRRGTLVDITCDSDGKVDQFISDDGEESSLPLHPLDGSPYYLGVFLTGAYQDILGDMHNLFGRVNEVHVYADEDEPKDFYIEKIVPGTTVVEALKLVQYYPSDLKTRMEAIIREKVRSKQLRPPQGVSFAEAYAKGLEEYTYYNYWDSHPEKE